MINRFCRKTCFAIGPGLLLTLLAGSAFGVSLTFTIDSAQSTLTGSGSIGGTAISEQGPGSLVTTFSGTVNVDLDDELNPTNLKITNLSLDAVAQGPWSPGVGGAPGTALADVAGQAAQILFNVKMALRDLLISGVTPSAVPVVSGQFTTTSLEFTVTSANLDYSGTALGSPVSGRTSLAPFSTNNVAGAGSLSYASNTATLAIPINIFVVKTVSGLPLILSCSGNLVATSPVTGNQPPTALADLYVTDQDIPIIESAPGVLVNDTDAESDPLQAIIGTNPVHSSSFLLNADGSFDYTPALNFSGIDLFTYHANDGTNDSAEANVFISVGANTPTGAVVNVQFDASPFGVNPISVTFLDVTTAGSTTVTPLDPSLAGIVPGSYSIFSNLVFDISTTAIATGPDEVCFTLTGVISSNSFAMLRVLHNEGGLLVDRTILPPDSPAPDYATQTLCARVDTLSPFAIALFQPAPHDLAVTSLKAPKKISLSASKPSQTKGVKVSIQNLSDHTETIPDLPTLQNLVTLNIESLGACPMQATQLLPPKNGFPVVLAPKKKLNLVYNLTFDCANDPEAGDNHLDYRYTAVVNHAALGTGADINTGNDTCPRGPNGTDKGCGGKTPAGTLGGDVLTDVIEK